MFLSSRAAARVLSKVLVDSGVGQLYLAINDHDTSLLSVINVLVGSRRAAYCVKDFRDRGMTNTAGVVLPIINVTAVRSVNGTGDRRRRVHHILAIPGLAI